MKLTSHDWTHVRRPDVNHQHVAIIRCPKIRFEATVHYWPSQEHLIGRLFNALVAAGRRGLTTFGALCLLCLFSEISSFKTAPKQRKIVVDVSIKNP